jgi:hypothetical protein
VRVDVLGSDPTAVQLGAGVALPLGIYARLGLAAGAGVGLGDATVGSGRAEGIVRFLLDPFAQSRWGVSGGAGLAVRHDAGVGTRASLTLVVDVEGRPRAGGWIPALQLGLGGGVRGGLVLRRVTRGWR